MNESTWLLIFPTAIALANFLPRPEETGPLLPQHRWLPTGLFALWLIVTAVHVYSIDYVYQFAFRGELVAPSLWVLAWTLYRSVPKVSSPALRELKIALLFPPLLIPLLVNTHAGNKTFLTLTGLNIALYFLICLVEKNRLHVCHLAAFSALMFLAGIPEQWLHLLSVKLNSTRCIASGAVVYLIFWTVLLRDPKLAILGSVAVGSAVMMAFGNHAGAIHWAFQSACVFLLVHSLRWDDSAHQGAVAARAMVVLIWVIQSFLWMRSDEGKIWMPCISGATVLGISFVMRMLDRKYFRPIVPIGAAIVILSGPGNTAMHGVHTMPIGLLAVIGSFLLFACGTIAALTKHIWHRPDSASVISETDENSNPPKL